MFIYSDDNKRYHTLKYHNFKSFGRKMRKAVINAGFTCPNIDGYKGYGGCTFCSAGGGYFTQSNKIDITKQLDAEISRIRLKDPDCGIIAYLQSNTNTYAPISILRFLYEKIINDNRVDALSVATRADCIDEDVISLFREIKNKKNITVELGLQTIFDSTAKRINRCHTYEEFLIAYKQLKKADIRVCVHIINGLPGESADMMVKTAEILGQLHPEAVKIHMLHIIKGTMLEHEYLSGNYIPMDISEYILTVVKQLRVLPQETVIERLTGDGDKSKILAPMWSTDKIRVLGSIDKLMSILDVYQGDSFRSKISAK